MNLYLARHGQASSPRPHSFATLTAQGKKDLHRMGRELQRQKIQVEQIWYSPKIRTKETAHLYASLLGIPPSELIENQNLSINADVNLILREISESSIEHLMLISHQPLLEELSSCLITGTDPLPHLFFPTAGIAAFKKAPSWEWLWLLEPSLLKT